MLLLWSLKLVFVALQLAPTAPFVPPFVHRISTPDDKPCCGVDRPTRSHEETAEDASFEQGFDPCVSEDTNLSGCYPISARRRHLLSLVAAVAATTSSCCLLPTNANAAPFFFEKPDNSVYSISPINRNATNSLMRTSTDIRPYQTSVELCLLKLLPVKNALFRQLEASFEGLSTLSGTERDAEAWTSASRNLQVTLDELDRKRGQLVPAFDPEVDDTLFQITRNVRCEQLVEQLRQLLVELLRAVQFNNNKNPANLFAIQKEALLTLSNVGELLVSKYPYQVPEQGKFSYLPRLQGRAHVTFTFRRFGSILGNVTIIADGFAAPITAGNFVDLSLRNFYTGLPVKFSKRAVGKSSGLDFEVANIPVLGSFQEGFYDPLTAKPRRIPLEIIRLEKTTGVPSLSYYAQGLSSTLTGRKTSVESSDSTSRPLLSFKTPGLVAMYHPTQVPNGGSSEFFALQDVSMLEDKRGLLDGEYAPFGFIVEGYDVFQELQPNDVISDTYVDDWGTLNLVKIRRSSFSEVVQGDGNTTKGDED